jgi:hypothetical protein
MVNEQAPIWYPGEVQISYDEDSFILEFVELGLGDRHVYHPLERPCDFP